MELSFIVAILICWFVGSIPFGWLIAKLWGVPDLRTEGSTNIGATNVVRTIGWTPGAITFLLDFLKGFLPYFFFTSPAFINTHIIFAGLFAILGHCFSPWLKFKGGKGVSTMLGVSFAIHPLLGSSVIGAYLLGLAGTRVSAMGSLAATFVFFFGAIIYFDGVAFKGVAAMIALLILSRHEKNWDGILKNAGLFLATVFFCQNVEAKAPERIVALLPNLAELVVDLGQGEKLIGVPEYTNLANLHMVSGSKVIGGHNSISAETVYSLNPDLVLAAQDGSSPQLLDQLKRLKLNVLNFKMDSLAEIISSVTQLELILEIPQSEKLKQLKLLLERLNKAEMKKGGIRVFVQVGWDPIVTINDKTFVNNVVQLSGGQNVFGFMPQKYPQLNAEEVLKKNPDVIIICSLKTKDLVALRSKEFWYKFDKLNAAKNRRIFILEGDLLLKPGFGLLVGASQLEKIFLETKL